MVVLGAILVQYPIDCLHCVLRIELGQKPRCNTAPARSLAQNSRVAAMEGVPHTIPEKLSRWRKHGGALAGNPHACHIILSIQVLGAEV
jgi:hypothetical protein